MLTVFEKDKPSLLCNIVSSLLSNGSDLLVTGTVNDPIYIQLVSADHTSNTDTDDTHRDKDYTNNTNETFNGGHMNGVTPKVNNGIESIHRIKNQGDDYYRHKFLLRLRKKQFYNNFDLGFYLLVKFGGPNTTMGISILNDDELLECSQISKFETYRDVEKWYLQQYNYLLSQYLKARSRKGLQTSQVNAYEKLAKLIPCKNWFDREKLHKKLVEQRHWNPFSIFGSSIPYVSINQVFNIESSDRYVVGMIKDGVLRRIENNMGISSTNGGTRYDEYEIGNEPKYYNPFYEEYSPNTIMMKYLRRKWIKESKKTTNWNYDPLLNVEALWYINSTGRYLDMSKEVCVLQKCYCTTPDPSVRFNWNDPRNRRDSPRGSMGFMLDYNDYKRARSRYIELDDMRNAKVCKKANRRGGKGQDSGDVEEEIKLAYYSNYFKHNTLR
ncbi:conserved hypothetical protein [Theileria orientalis strain Shintoku]|uniref:Inner centromere protein ARK-binding domain-containing protein n=1 Tax=Theileria orientalis strain Shintoku TaxID=869250 RepID=J7MGX8_THEOR|nr:conserved hypothetical protein [Theileria orientalis strain Shintoku]BAM42376.1 conserved hypothetical protein [Theileria orientalis strain Shintoku]|eukprot:XP_009692677.1 conserved hypothetical protein [Theileria orientalis strain Shintoku]